MVFSSCTGMGLQLPDTLVETLPLNLVFFITAKVMICQVFACPNNWDVDKNGKFTELYLNRYYTMTIIIQSFSIILRIVF